MSAPRRPRRWTQHALSFGVLALFLAFNTATSPSRRTPLPPWDAGPSPGTEGGVDAGPDSAAAALEPDVDSIRALVGCIGVKKEGCRVLDDFAAGTTPATASLPKERVVYFGKSWGIGGKDDGKFVFSFLVVEGGGRKGAFLPLDETDGPDADALVGKAKSGLASGTSPAAAFMRSMSPPDGFHPLLPTAVSLRIRAEVPAWVRQSGVRWIVLEHTGATIEKPGGRKANAWVSELWRLK